METNMRLIEVRSASNTPIKVNPDHIAMLNRSNDSEHPTIIHLVTGRGIKVKQTIQEIEDMARRAE